MTQATKILYVEDDKSLAFITKDHLEMNGYDVTLFEDGETAKNAFNTSTFDICIFDVMLPKVDGFTLCEYVRQTNPHIPIIMLTAKSLKEDKITGLKTGADDYITKPFSIEELILKIQIFLRRSKVTQIGTAGTIRLGSFEFDPSNYSLKHPENDRILTQRESELLTLLSNNIGRVLKRSDILTKIWGEDDYFLGRSLDVFISRLRKYLSHDPNLQIENIHGVGFKFNIKPNS